MAVLTGADLLVILTDTDGLFDKNPHENADARLIPVVETITPETMALCGGAGTARGTGGMLTKVHAAKTATERGIPVVVMNGSDPQALYRVLDGDSIGTLFLGK